MKFSHFSDVEGSSETVDCQVGPLTELEERKQHLKEAGEHVAENIFAGMMAEIAPLRSQVVRIEYVM